MWAEDEGAAVVWQWPTCWDAEVVCVCQMSILSLVVIQVLICFDEINQAWAVNTEMMNVG